MSERFDGLTRIQQHKLIYDVFGDEVGGAIHALSIKTANTFPGRRRTMTNDEIKRLHRERHQGEPA